MKVTISGLPGAGKTSMAKELADRLKLKFFEMGRVAQRIALRRKLTIRELMEKAKLDPSVDKEIDAEQRLLGKSEDNFVIDGRISFVFIPDAFHIFLEVDERVGAERIFSKEREADEPKYLSVGWVHPDNRFDIELTSFERSVESTRIALVQVMNKTLEGRLQNSL